MNYCQTVIFYVSYSIIKVTNGQQKKKSKAKQEDKQWEEWKKKDDELVNDHYQQDLQCAILQSKLEFEQKKRNPPVVQITEVSSLKKKKSKTMSLDEFLEQRTVNENGTNFLMINL